MYKKMLVLLDGSKLAEVVFTYAQELVGRLNLDLELLHVCTPQEADQLPMRQAYMNEMAKMLQMNADKIRAKLGEKPASKAIKAEGKVVVGYPAEEILKYTDANNIDLIMLATHGRSGVRMWDVGAVADKVIHAAKVPVWLVPSELREEIIYEKLPKNTMVIPLSGSKESEAVIPYAISVAKQRGIEIELILVHVEKVDSLTLNIHDIKKQEARGRATQDYLDEKVKLIKEAGIPARSVVLAGGQPFNPAATIIDFLRNNPAQLMALATRGSSGINKMIFGSVAEDLVHSVKKTPILLVRPG